MNALALILLLLSILGGIACLMMLIVSFFEKNFKFKPKQILIAWGGYLAIFFISFVVFGVTLPKNTDIKSTTVKAESTVKEQPKEKTEEEKAAEEAKKKADEEAKVKADAEANKAKEEAAKKAEEEKVAYDTGITYNQLARTPDDYKGKKAKFTGKVIQVMEGDKETDLRIAVDGNYDTVLFVGYDPKIISTRILENDNVTITGKSVGIYSYQSTMGGKISIPGMWGDNIVINNK